MRVLYEKSRSFSIIVWAFSLKCVFFQIKDTHFIVCVRL
ncbi:hypothetical protein EMIT019CA3_50202 [Bacillus pseudomycoides]